MDKNKESSNPASQLTSVNHTEGQQVLGEMQGTMSTIQPNAPPPPYDLSTPSYPPVYPPAFPPSYPPSYPQDQYYTPLPGSDPSTDKGVPCTSTGPAAVLLTVPESSPPKRESYCAHIALSCVVTWICCWILGIIAFVFAVMAQKGGSRRSEQSRQEARCFGKLSIGLSISGCIIGIISLIYLSVKVYYAYH